MAWFRRSPEQRRVKAASVCREGPLAAYLAVPFADPAMLVRDVEFLALDFETTGLDPASDRIVAVGFVPVRGGRIELRGAGSLVVAAGVDVGASATVHGLTDDTVAAGVPLAEAMAQVLAAMTGRVLLAHFASLEERFLRQACEALWGSPVPLQRVDTMELARRRLTRGFHEEPAPGSLRLWAARDRYGLPAYRAHDPLVDALSCAELFLAQVDESGGSSEVSLKSVLS